MWSKTMVYSTAATPDGYTELTIGDDSILVDVDHAALETPALQDRYADLQSFSENARTFQILKHKLAFTLFIIIPLVAIMMVPFILNQLGVTGSGTFEELIWLLGLTVSAGAFLSACALSTVRSYYRWRVLSKLDSELNDIEDELRRRGLDIE